jgi:hypothetical protein
MRCHPSIRQWTLLSLLLIAVGLVGIGHQAEANDNGHQKATFQIMVFNETPSSLDPATGAARLHRTRNELWASLHVTELEPNSAFTIWGVIFNRPEECETNPAGDVKCGMNDFTPQQNPAQASVFNVGAFITGDDGAANINIHIPTGALPDGTFVLFGQGGLNDNGVKPGLRPGNGFGAEVHLFIRTHGAINPDAIAAQLSDANGGCPPNTCVNIQVAPFPAVHCNDDD